MSDSFIARRMREIETVVINPIDNSRSIMYVSSNTFTMPTNVVNNEVKVQLVGAGNSNTGFGENKTETIQLQPGESVQVYVGKEGKEINSGGTTSFGTYMFSAGSSYDIASSTSNISDNMSEVDSGDGYAVITYKIEGAQNE